MGFLLEIISPQGKIFNQTVKKVTVPAVTGQLTILSHHASLFTPLNPGKIRVIDLNNKIYLFPVGKGMIEVSEDKVNLLIEGQEDLDKKSQQQAQKAQTQAEELKKKPKSPLAPTQELRRSLVGTNIAKYKKKRRISPTAGEQI
ncbi:ATP synthase F1 subunit epsilon [Candidatus Beckwithbacteria bacterium CG10_big_fil_rev_8_21_14_0_10_34_10]|uniref:ATP synthase epsilon chain n=1 Tax=Candidatus Beckwithbacteria bacterium CG10_big_fil_rev_8_21_14_0_10_34_10 TaxID=1974495 RepID=A0A2H0W8W8_9BACT|nr:MAG: ATP synthase F1 subunit epsilon [Candidatus Beckwithbacteria bacterium CG10_big_fil_rev_8_21_14_0_10_34_10]